MVLFARLHIFLIGFISGVYCGQSTCSTSISTTAFLGPAKNNESRGALVGTGNRAVLQTVPLRSLKFSHTEDRLGDSIQCSIQAFSW